MCVRSDTALSPSPNGHALMATCPPYSHIDQRPDEPYPHKMPDLPAVHLMKLFQLSGNLSLDGELTSVMALNMIRSHDRYADLTAADFEVLGRELRSKMRCYG